MYCLFLYFNFSCGKFGLFHLDSICFQKEHQYADIRLSSQLNFSHEKLVPALFTKVFSSKQLITLY